MDKALKLIEDIGMGDDYTLTFNEFYDIIVNDQPEEGLDDSTNIIKKLDKTECL